MYIHVCTTTAAAEATTITTTTTITYIHGPPRFLPTGAPLDGRLIPQFVGGVHHLKSLLLPPNPAIPPYVVRTPHPGITDGREHIRA